MNTITTPVPARTDLSPAYGLRQGGRILSPRVVRTFGGVVTALAAAHGAAFGFYAVQGWDDAGARLALDLGGIGLVLGVALLSLVMAGTRAWGGRLFWRISGWLTLVLTLTALCGMVVNVLVPENESVLVTLNTLMFAGLGAFYLSSIGVAATGRWRGVLRYLPLALSSWGPVLAIVGSIHEPLVWWFFVGYLGLLTLTTGLVLALRPRDAGTSTAL